MSSNNALLNQIDWDDGFEIPVANENNKRLETDVRSRQEQLLNVKNEDKTHQNRVSVLTNHLNNVKQDLNLTVQLLASKKRSRDSENHQKMVYLLWFSGYRVTCHISKNSDTFLILLDDFFEKTKRYIASH